ncbi:MAG: DNA-directed RNA polymerase subunit alpha [Phycisphaerae bacterium]
MLQGSGLDQDRLEIIPMRIRWRGLELPSRVVRDEAVSTESYARFLIEPFEQGFGTTIGNSLRRVLLSSLEGAAVTTVKIDGVSHEFTSIDGVLEDVTDILLNIKGIVLRLDGDESKRMSVQRNTIGEVRAGDIVADPAITIVKPDHVIATLTADVNFHVEMTVAKGRGYKTGSENRAADQELGVIPVDSIFSPVLRVRYRTEDMRVGQRTNYDRLILEVWTNKTVSPEDALVEAGLILRKHLNLFVMYHDLGDQVVSPTQASFELPPPENSALEELLGRSVSMLNLSVRASNCLQAARITTLRELVSRAQADLLRFRSFGKTSLHEVQRKLAEVGLQLGMTTDQGAPTSEGAPADEATPDTTDASDAGFAGDSSVPAETGPMEAYTMGD